MYFVFKRKVNNIFMKNFIKFYQNRRNFSQNAEKTWMKSTEFTLFSEKFKPR